MITENEVDKVGLRKFPFFGISTKQLLILVRDRDWLVVLGESPTTLIAVEFTSLAHAALQVVALLTKGLPISLVTGTPSGSGLTMVRTQLYIGLLPPAVTTAVSILLFERFPFFFRKLCSGLPLGPYLQADQLIACALLDDRCEALVSLELAQSSKRVNIGFFSSCCAKIVDQLSDFILRHMWARNAMPHWPHCVENCSVVNLIRRSGRHEVGNCVCQPLKSLFRCFGRLCSWLNQETFACSFWTHKGVSFCA